MVPIALEPSDGLEPSDSQGGGRASGFPVDNMAHFGKSGKKGVVGQDGMTSHPRKKGGYDQAVVKSDTSHQHACLRDRGCSSSKSRVGH